MSNITTNEIPSLTWNWMKMNRDSIELPLENLFSEEKPEYSKLPQGVTIEAEKAIEQNIPETGSGICNKSNPKLNAENNAKEEQNPCAIQEHPVNKLIDKVVQNKALITISGNISEPVIFNLAKSGNLINVQKILAKKDSNSTVIFVYSANDSEIATKIARTQIYVEENAKIHIIKVQLLGNNTLQLDDTGISALENANVHFTQIELGGSHVNSGLHVSLYGKQAKFTSNVAYICKDKQKLDMNHIVYHYAEKTECNMKVNGTLKDSSAKTYRGTIDFKKGCAGSIGHEIEETLLLNPKVVNKSLPVILCDEEDVEGTHGASIGRLSNDILFYMQTRGISKEEAEKLMSLAKVQAVADLIPDENIKNKIIDFISEETNN